MNKSRTLTVSIFGDQYCLASDEDEQAIVDAAARVDALMRTQSRARPDLNGRRLAVLAALQLAHLVDERDKRLEQCESQSAQLTAKITHSIQDTQ
jgi:cell division protein ZapA (FtsZ GTPase activity inhibitor)